MFKVYIASPLKMRGVNQGIASVLEKRLGAEAEVFLPITFGVPGDTDDITALAEHLYQKIDDCDVVILVVPYGLSVAAEAGYVVGHKRLRPYKEKPLIKYLSGEGSVKEEYMIDPFVDHHAESMEDLVTCVSRLMSEKGTLALTQSAHDC